MSKKNKLKKLKNSRKGKILLKSLAKIKKGKFKQKTKVKKESKSKKNVCPCIQPLDRKISKNRELNLISAPEIMEYVKNIAGEEGYMVFENLVHVGKMIDEYSLAEKVKLQINYVRSLLYKLYDQKLVFFRRDRDKKKGWFIYSWCAHPEKLKYILITQKRKEVSRLSSMLNQKEDKFFCKACDKDFSYSKAVETMFFCECCGGHLEAINSASVRENIAKEIAEIENEIKCISDI